MPLEFRLLGPRGDVPDLDERVAAAGRQPAAVGREGDGPDAARMGCDRGEFLAARGVPDHDAAIFPGSRQPRAVRGEIQRSNPALLFLQVGLEFSGRKVPEFHEPVIAGRGSQTSVAGEFHGPDRRRMAGQFAIAGSIGLPDDQVSGPVEEAFTPRGDERGSVTGEVGRDHPATVGIERCGRPGGRARRRRGRGGRFGADRRRERAQSGKNHDSNPDGTIRKHAEHPLSWFWV